MTRKSSHPELSPRGAERRRSTRPLKSTPAGTPVCAQQPLHAAVGRDVDLAACADDVVEVLARFKDLDQKLPGGRAVLRLQLAHGIIRAQCLTVVLERHLQLGRDWMLGSAGVPLG